MARDGSRREEILQAAASLFASHGSRVSLDDIGKKCGVLGGSLYHHFESKEAIVIELVRRYQADLDRLAERALEEAGGQTPPPISDQIVSLGTRIAACAVQHRAALLLTVYEPASGASEELVELAGRTPMAIDAAMLELLRTGRESGYIRSGIDLGRLAERLCRSMLHVGAGVLHPGPGNNRVPALKARILLNGVAADASAVSSLDGSPALAAADLTMATWIEEPSVDDNATNLRNIVRSEFARRGYEGTTLRDIASAAGISTSTVYKWIGSKDQLLLSVMGDFSQRIATGWDNVLESKASPLEKLDALLWLDINALERFSDEVKIMLSWLRQTPPTAQNLGHLYLDQLRRLKTLISEGEEAGEMNLVGGTSNIRARCVLDLIAMPETIVRSSGTRAAHALARDTVILGAADPTWGS
ncbi:HTH-type transcriptional repressor KstR2 [Mycolicibacterium vanbaalenii]|uniref:HTH-type transcriptional repressor KstR2 n=1 Tax=Mycolicibacterium vanbaalenii TaxID=110539 RepID=A0A5S9QYP8_MYCVN|nr:TetR/AcrR family transcriptional regulator [Mycolicibacterium vanbaalenii]CAA0124559.1 HTH-type transcriptional repressor KstR2 [Mycolicibacterium vanbaalenii]